MTLSELESKSPKLILGLMSGTSADGIDAALVRIHNQGKASRIQLIDHAIYPHECSLREAILQLSTISEVAVSELCGLNVLLAQQFACAALSLAKKVGVSAKEIDLIGCHGQTIRHLPAGVLVLGKEVTYSWQIGDPAIIAKITGIPTVGDFRIADMALGGQGAPLVPLLDFHLFRSDQEARLCLNIGGISNITYLPKAAGAEKVLAFDTGPGNMLLDAAAQYYYHQAFDRDGHWAQNGTVDTDLLERWLQEPFIHQPPPKSTGRERFNLNYLFKLKEMADRRGASLEDFFATLTALTVDAVFSNYEKFLLPRGPVQRVIVSGGGCRNPEIMLRLRTKFYPAEVVLTDQMGWPSEAKEAICFALLANETICGRPGNLPSVTGADRATILGKICLAD